MKIRNLEQDALILIIEDSMREFELITQHLKTVNKNWSFLNCSDRSDFVEILSQKKPDLIISNYSLPSFSSIEALKTARETYKDIPFIVVSGPIDEDKAISLIVDDKVNDYLSKDNLKRLGQSVLRELKNLQTRNELKKTEQEQKRSLKLLRAINDITTSLLDVDSLSDIANTITDNVMSHFDFEDCVIYRFDTENNLLVQVASTGHRKSDELKNNNAFKLKPGEGIVGSVAISLKPEIVHDLTIDDRYVKDLESNQSEITVPIILDGNLIGIIDSEHKEKGFYTQLHLQDLQTVAGVIATKFKAGQERERSKVTALQLEKNELHLRQITHNIDAAAFRYIIYPSGEGEFLYASPKTLDIYEISPEEAQKNDLLIWNQTSENDRKWVNNIYEQAIKTGTHFSMEFRIQTPSGVEKWIETTGSITKQDDGSVISDTINRDITQRIETAKQIEEKEALLRTLTDNIPGVIIRYTEDNERNSQIEYISEGCLEIFEVSQTEILEDDSKLWELIFPEDIEAMMPTIEESANTMTMWDFIYRIKTKSGEIKYLHGNGTPRKSSTGDKTIWDTVLLDKTDEILFEDELRRTNTRLLQAQEVANFGDWSLDMETGKAVVSPTVRKIHEVDDGFVFDITKQESFFKKGYDRDRKQFVFDRAIEKGTPFDEELKLITSKGNERWVKYIGQAEFNNGICSRLYGTMMDITEQRKLRSSIESSLKEKTLLLAEIHHRVKNNLAIVTGLLDLQSIGSDDENLKKILGETARRIKSIAKVHELLYNTDSFSDIPFDKYVENLTNSISETLDDKKGVINLNIDKELIININQAIPLGLLLNELITNSFKYAFDSTKKKNQIDFSLNFKNDTYHAHYSDSGSGFDKSKLKDSSSLGALLIDTLFKQLDAEFEIETETGFNVAFTFTKTLAGAHSNI